MLTRPPPNSKIIPSSIRFDKTSIQYKIMLNKASGETVYSPFRFKKLDSTPSTPKAYSSKSIASILGLKGESEIKSITFENNELSLHFHKGQIKYYRTGGSLMKVSIFDSESAKDIAEIYLDVLENKGLLTNIIKFMSDVDDKRI